MDDLANMLDEVASRTRFSGVVRIDRRGEVVLEAAHGLAHRGDGLPTTPATRFGIASGTKGITAVTVMSLVEEGVLGLDTAARSLLGGDLPSISDGVTVEHLLAHRSGIGDYLEEDGEGEGWDPYAYAMPVPVHELASSEQYLAVLDGHPTRFAPGERFAYCNGGYVVLALLAERATRTPFHELVEDRVCGPAGMSRSGFFRSDEPPGGMALGYLRTDGTRTNIFHLPVRGSGDGGFVTTAGDMARFWAALFAGRLVTPAVLEQMIRPTSAGRETADGYGLGFWLPADRPGTVVLEGCDPGVSFRSWHVAATGVTGTVLSNTTEGAWPISRQLEAGIGGSSGWA